MKLSYKLIIAAFFVTAIGSFIWSANYYYSKYQYEKKRADEAVQNAESATLLLFCAPQLYGCLIFEHLVEHKLGLCFSLSVTTCL